MANWTNRRQTPAQACAAGMFSFHKYGIQRHAFPVCLSLSLGLLITVELLGVLSLAAVVLSLVLLITGLDRSVRPRMEG